MTGLPPPSCRPSAARSRLVLVAPARSPHDRPPSAVVSPVPCPFPPCAPSPSPPFPFPASLLPSCRPSAARSRLVLLAPARSPHDRPPSAVVSPVRCPFPPRAPSPRARKSTRLTSSHRQ